MSKAKSPHRQNITGQNTTNTKCYSANYRLHKMPQGKTPLGQNTIYRKGHIDKMAQLKSFTAQVCVEGVSTKEEAWSFSIL